METQNNYICKIATLDESIEKWDYEVNIHSDNLIYPFIKKIYIEEIIKGTRINYIGKLNNEIICDATIIIKKKGLKKEGNNKYKVITPKRVFMCAVRTNKEYEGKGYFSKLLSFIEKDLMEKGYQELSLGVKQTEENNIAMYKHLGFTNYLGTEIREGIEDIYLYDYYYKKINTSN